MPPGSPEALRRWLNTPGAFAVGKLPPRAQSWPASRLTLEKDAWLFDIDDWRMDISRDWRMLWRPAADFPEELRHFMMPAFSDAAWRTLDLPATWEALGCGTPLYINSGWAFHADPPNVPTTHAASPDASRTILREPNPTARLRRRFDLPVAWQTRQTRLWIGAAQAAVAVWCNGAFVGFSQGGSDVAEFDLTPHVRPSGNVLALQVFKYASGSYLEDQDAWRVSGIYREVFLYSVAPSHVADVLLAPDFEAKTLTAHVKVAQPPPGGQVEVRAGNERRTVAAGREISLSLDATDMPAWNPEEPALVPVCVILRDKAGAILDVRHFRTALCRSQVVDGVYRLNGRPFKFQGVNRHEIDPLHFRVVSRASMLKDAQMMKAAHFNAMRCSHYTHHPLWYEICDRMGLAVMAEANVESHGLSYHKCVLPGDLAPWVAPTHARLRAMVSALANHPSVVMWSLGNEAGWGGAFESGAALVRALDPLRRPIQYADMNAVADFDSQTYPSVAWMKAWLAGTAVRKGERGEAAAMRQHGPQPSGKPYVANEYAHAMGNSTGNFAEYWELFDREARLAGGFIWEWVEHGISSRDARGRPRAAAFPDARTWLYGGDFGDVPHEGNFCCDGLVRADGTPNPGLDEVRHVQQPMCVLSRTPEGCELFNRYFFRALTPKRHDLAWTLMEQGQVVQEGVWPIEKEIAPRTSWRQPFGDLPSARGGERVVRIALREDGAIRATCEVVLSRGPFAPPLPRAGGHALFSALWQPVFTRVATDNDRGGRFKNPTNVHGHVVSKASGAVQTLVFDVRGEHARRGIRCRLPFDAVKSVSWYGRGPGENMPDRCRGALLGIWGTEDPLSLATPYTRAQENGLRWDVRWLTLTAADGRTVRISADRPFGFTLRPYSSEQLAQARHFTDLPPYATAPREWELILDAAHRGVGGDNSWGMKPMDVYRLWPCKGDFTWTFTACAER